MHANVHLLADLAPCFLFVLTHCVSSLIVLFSFIWSRCLFSSHRVVQRERYRLRVRASDKGDPPSYADVDVELDVVDRNNKPPLWDKNVYSPIYIRENVTVSTVVHSVKARFVQLPPMVPNVSFLSYLLHYSILRYRYRTATVIIQQL